MWTDIILRDGLYQEWLILAGDSGSNRRDTWGTRKSPCNVYNPAWTDSSCRDSPSAFWLCDLCPCMHVQSLQLSPTLCEPTDSGPPGPSTHGILQARKLEWVAMPSSKRSSPPKD